MLLSKLMSGLLLLGNDTYGMVSQVLGGLGTDKFIEFRIRNHLQLLETNTRI